MNEKKDLIELTSTEKFLQDSGFRMTLKEVADTYNKKHYNMVRDFHKMIAEVSEDNLASLKYEGSSYIGRDNREVQTISMAMQTMVWFIAKFSVLLDIHNIYSKHLSHRRTICKRC